MEALLVACLWLFNAGAFAEPVPLFSAGPPLAADDPIYRLTEHIEDFKRAHAIVLNPAAFGANVVTVQINGKVHTFDMRPSDLHATGRTVWVGEENDDSFDMRPEISLSRSDNGRLSGGFFLPPRSSFSIESGPPARLIERESDWGVRPGPSWLPWLRLAAILLVIGSVLAVGTAFRWHRDGSRQSSASRLARADAAIFGGTLLLFALVASCIDRRADWNPEHLDMGAVFGILFFVALGAGIVFWRVHAAYETAAASILRSMREGLVGAALVFLVILAAMPLVELRWQWEMLLMYWQVLDLESYGLRYLKLGSIFSLIGAPIGAVLWAINRYLLNGTIIGPGRRRPNEQRTLPVRLP